MSTPEDTGLTMSAEEGACSASFSVSVMASLAVSVCAT